MKTKFEEAGIKKGAEKSVTEISIRQKEKWTNKGTDKQETADYFLHSTTYHS